MSEKQLTGYPSIDKPWLKYYSEEAISAPIPECTSYEYIWKNNKEHLEDVALIYFGKRIKYKRLFEKVDEACNAFVANGVKKGDKVIIFSSSTPEFVFSLLALMKIGAVANMINPVFAHEQIKQRVNETDAKIMLVLDVLFDRIRPIISELCTEKIIVMSVCNEMSGITKMVATLKKKKGISYNNNVVRWSEFLLDGRKVEISECIEYEKNMPAVMVYSSGTTGASKGIVLTNNGINATITHYLSPDFPYTRGDVFLQMIPVWFSTGVVLSILMPLCIGVTVVLEPMFCKENFVKGIKKYKPKMTLAPVSLWIYAMESEELKKINLNNMTYPFTGGELVLPKVENRINEFLRLRNCKSPLLKGYGMCELGSTVATDSLVKQKPEATGFPMKGVIVSAFDILTNEELKYGERGEIRVDSPAHMKEYFKNESATEEFFYKDTTGTMWGRTGDMGYVDEDGFVYILGRINDTFIAENQEKIYCFDVEAEILKNEHVAQCEVVGIAVGEYEIPVAHIIMDEHSNLQENELVTQIHSSLSGKLSEYCVPQGYKVCKTFPIKSSGKRDMEQIKNERQGFVIPTIDGVNRISF